MVAVGFAGCNGFGGKSKEDELIVLREMNRSLENALNFIDLKNNSTAISFVNKLMDPNTSLKAQSLKQQFDSTIIISDNIRAYIDSFEKGVVSRTGIAISENTSNEHYIELSKEISIKSEKQKQLIENLKNYRTKLLSLDSNVQNEFGERLPKYEQYHFNNKMPLIEALTLFSKLKTDIATSEGFILDFYEGRATSFVLICESYLPTVEVNAL